MYHATNQENTSLTRAVSALPVVVDVVSALMGSIRTATSSTDLCHLYWFSCRDKGEWGVIESSVDASVSKPLGPL
jgi:hypothetical protein